MANAEFGSVEIADICQVAQRLVACRCIGIFARMAWRAGRFAMSNFSRTDNLFTGGSNDEIVESQGHYAKNQEGLARSTRISWRFRFHVV
jgi:hypothetical protein